MKNYKTYKVFHWWYMPEDLRNRSHDSIFDHLRNNSFMRWEVNNKEWSDLYSEIAAEIDRWLIANGAQPQEEVLILIEW